MRERKAAYCGIHTGDRSCRVRVRPHGYVSAVVGVMRVDLRRKSKSREGYQGSRKKTQSVPKADRTRFRGVKPPSLTHGHRMKPESGDDADYPG